MARVTQERALAGALDGGATRGEGRSMRAQYLCLVGVMCISVEVKARGKVLWMSMVHRKGVGRIGVVGGALF